MRVATKEEDRMMKVAAGITTSLDGYITGSNDQLMLGDLDSCRSTLRAVDLQRLESLSRLVITVAAGLTRYHAVEHERRRRAGAHDPTDRPALIRDLLRDVSAIFSPSAQDRTGDLRNFFFAMLMRDVKSLRTASA
jgi:hypothetical protein